MLYSAFKANPIADMAADSAVCVLTEALSAPSLLLSAATSLGKRQLDVFSSTQGVPMESVDSGNKVATTSWVKGDETLRRDSERVKAMKQCLVDPSKTLADQRFKRSKSETVSYREKLSLIRDMLEVGENT